jgi:hypothetical protein
MITNEFDTHNGKYTIRSFGNGWAYEVRCNNPNPDDSLYSYLWFQDHDADQLQTDTNNFEDTVTIDQYFECLEG